MKSNSLQIITTLIEDLPESDLKFAHKFLKSRDFDSLELLVKSAIINVRNSFTSINPKELMKYKDYIDNPGKLDNMLKLETEVAAYNSMLKVILGDEDEEEFTGPYFDPDNYSEEDL